MHIRELVEQVRSLDLNTLTLDRLYRFALGVDLNTLEVEQELPMIKDNRNYARNILLMEPIEVVLLVWPPGVESAIHHHEGFWGVVGVLDGELDNVMFSYDGKYLKEQRSERGLPGGWIREEDGVIHMLKNPSNSEAAVTVHIYYPPLQSFEGMRIFDVASRRLGVLNANAETASWNQSEACFDRIEEHAFEFISMSAQEEGPSHRVNPIVPKPDDETIQELIGEYYAEQANLYDHFDASHETRTKYIQRVNKLIAEDLKSKNSISSYLGIACGTGRRMHRIQEIAGLNYMLSGVDLSVEMCDVARSRGIKMYNAPWLETELGNQTFDTITFLYAFGHISNEEFRLESLQKVYDHLSPGGHFYVDVFNVDDRNEWGPQAVEVFEDLRLEHMGYDRGDVFYKKSGGDAPAYLHYFEESEICALVERVGLKVREVHHIGYTKKPGELLDNSQEGALFLIAEKP